jgi:aspartate-semialdehyde dehydrogenase
MTGPTTPTQPIPVAVLGATGAVGQRFVQLLDGHPWFQVVALTGSERAAGKPYAETCHWILDTPMPGWARAMHITPSNPQAMDVTVAFSALPSSSAWEVEAAYARAGSGVCSNASAYRQEPDVPLVLPEVNPEHTALISTQRKERGWRGFIVTNANCTITGLTVVLKALADRFGLRQAFVVSLQAVSGAGYPGVASMDILGNIIPHIPDEEEKMALEPLKILGRLYGERIVPADFPISAHANRVPVVDGHSVCLSVGLERSAKVEDIREALAQYRPAQISQGLPSAPQAAILVSDEPDRPQPRLDRMAGGGMTTVVGRIRPDPILDARMVILSHNTIRGAAGGSILNAEVLVRQGYIHSPSP